MASEDTINLEFIKMLASSGEPTEERHSKTPRESKPAENSDSVESGKKAPKKRKNPLVMLLAFLAKAAVILVSLALTVVLLSSVVMVLGSGSASAEAETGDVTVMDKFDMFMTNQISSALEGILNIDKVYWLSESDLVAPKPNPANYGTVDKPEDLMWLLEEAADLIDGQEMLFNENTPVWDGDKIYYYYDETILVITWKEYVGRAMYTVSEVKIAHPSQFRRFLAGGEFGSDKQYVTTDMASSVNAVVASSGDFYKHRLNGVVVYEGQIKRAEFKWVDTCFISADGDLILSPKKQFTTMEQAQQFVADNDIRFSLAFGPILVNDGVACVPKQYTLGEIDGNYSRAALCQMDKLHYLLVNATAQFTYQLRPNMEIFADVLVTYGVDKAYALDGGQTTVIAMDGKAINSVDYGYQRQISDIIYFATALPDGE